MRQPVKWPSMVTAMLSHNHITGTKFVTHLYDKDQNNWLPFPGANFAAERLACLYCIREVRDLNFGTPPESAMR
jgi:hypothetical protein